MLLTNKTRPPRLAEPRLIARLIADDPTAAAGITREHVARAEEKINVALHTLDERLATAWLLINRKCYSLAVAAASLGYKTEKTIARQLAKAEQELLLALGLAESGRPSSKDDAALPGQYNAAVYPAYSNNRCFEDYSGPDLYTLRRHSLPPESGEAVAKRLLEQAAAAQLLALAEPRQESPNALRLSGSASHTAETETTETRVLQQQDGTTVVTYQDGSQLVIHKDGTTDVMRAEDVAAQPIAEVLGTLSSEQFAIWRMYAQEGMTVHAIAETTKTGESHIQWVLTLVNKRFVEHPGIGIDALDVVRWGPWRRSLDRFPADAVALTAKEREAWDLYYYRNTHPVMIAMQLRVGEDTVWRRINGAGRKIAAHYGVPPKQKGAPAGWCWYFNPLSEQQKQTIWDAEQQYLKHTKGVLSAFYKLLREQSCGLRWTADSDNCTSDKGLLKLAPVASREAKPHNKWANEALSAEVSDALQLGRQGIHIAFKGLKDAPNKELGLRESDKNPMADALVKNAGPSPTLAREWKPNAEDMRIAGEQRARIRHTSGVIADPRGETPPERMAKDALFEEARREEKRELLK